MTQLEVRTYTRQEIATILKLDTSNKNFARSVKDTLTKWGYSFEYSRKQVKIIRKPENAKEKLTELMIRDYGMDVQIDVYGFATFLYCLLLDLDNFSSMPWEVRKDYMKECFEVSVDSRTLRNWCSKFLDAGTIVKDKLNRTYWRTFWIDGEKVREAVDKDDVNRKQYWKDFWKLQEEGNNNIYKILIEKYGCCYYSCGSLIVSNFDEVGTIKEIADLVNAVIESNEKETVVRTITQIL